VAAVSEGARDQLYLALRLAYLEDYGRRSEPIPFVGDDLFMTFDDDRTKHGLVALAALSDDVQPILFTHHRHVVELARQVVGDALELGAAGVEDGPLSRAARAVSHVRRLQGPAL
jgi:chromosome segregation protein